MTDRASSNPLLAPARRLRRFLMRPVLEELAALRQEVAALREEVRAAGLRQDASIEPRIEAVLEQAVLTLALAREARR